MRNFDPRYLSLVRLTTSAPLVLRYFKGCHNWGKYFRSSPPLVVLNQRLSACCSLVYHCRANCSTRRNNPRKAMGRASDSHHSVVHLRFHCAGHWLAPHWLDRGIYPPPRSQRFHDWLCYQHRRGSSSSSYGHHRI